VRQFVSEKDAKVVVIDTLNGFLQAMPGEQLLAIHLHELLSYLNHRGVVSLLNLAQSGLIGTHMQTAIDVSYLADNVLLLRYFEIHGEVRQALSVVKRRAGKHERTIRELKLSDGKITVGSPLTNFQGILTGTPLIQNGKPAQD
jgi:circadian clock protein KaiC